MINHILIEAFCLKNIDKYAHEPYPSFCPTEGKCATFQCLFHKCKYIDFTSCEDTLCYIGEASDEVYGVTFGGNMEEGNPNIGIETWKDISISKIDEAYALYMEKKALVSGDDQEE